jgi:hypothetical protein
VLSAGVAVLAFASGKLLDLRERTDPPEEV